MKAYPCPLGLGCHYYRAPIYLAGTLVGVFAMVFSKQVAVKLRLVRPVRPSPSPHRQTLPLLTLQRPAPLLRSHHPATPEPFHPVPLKRGIGARTRWRRRPWSSRSWVAASRSP